MAYPIELSRHAAGELSASFDWYLERSPAAAEGFLNAVDTAMRVVAESPEIWPEFEAGTRRYVFERYPFSLIFGFDGNRVFVHAIAHQSRKPGYWHG